MSKLLDDDNEVPVDKLKEKALAERVSMFS